METIGSIPPTGLLVIFAVMLFRLTIPGAILVASLMVLGRVPSWIGGCLVAGSSITLLCRLPSAGFLLLNRYLTTAQIGVITMWVGAVSLLGGVLFTVGFFGLVIKAGKPHPHAPSASP